MGNHPPANLQAKLTVNQPGDPYEQEADRVADQVVRRKHQATPAIPGEEEEEQRLMRKQRSSGAQAAQGESAPPVVNQALSSGGQPLDAGTQASMESHFGQDFSDVRIHTDGQAAESAQAINAQAYTVGKDVVFGEGQYAPGTSEGERLLAHELTHVVQQQERRTQGTAILQRELKYHGQVEPEKAQAFLEAFDRSVEIIATDISEAKGLVGQEAKDLRAALEELRALKKKSKVTVWYTSEGNDYASYDNASGELRLHFDFGAKATLPTTLVHEAIHAVHAKRHPGLSRMYGELLKAGTTTDEHKGVLTLRWKAWTEYWAYRRAAEYNNLRQEPRFRRDPHQAAIEEKDVQRSIANLRNKTGEEIDPQRWKPPAEKHNQQRRHEEETTR